MPRIDYKICKGCSRHIAECGPLSHTRLCASCGIKRLAENVEGLANHSGEPLLRWRIGMVRCAFGDDLLRELGVG
jgi:hypothetical protein